jgi:hypothetical protein
VPSGDAAEVTMRFTHPDPDRLVASGRPWLLVFLPAAMQVGAPLRVHGPVDAGTVEGLMEWQEAMVGFRPHLRVVPISADLDDPTPGPLRDGGITAFSGGVDSSFTVVRSAQARDRGTHAYRDARARAGLIVHGFDIPQSQPEAFESAVGRVSGILDAHCMELHRLATDVRSLEARFGCDWETECHGIWLAAALACLEGPFTHTIIPSTFPYHAQKLPWASNPFTDHLLGSSSRPLLHDGAGYDKLGKVEVLADVPSVLSFLRVCWEGAQLDRNCGHCYKCVATQACFWAVGVPSLAAFDSPCTVEEVAGSAVDDVYRVHLARTTKAAAARRGLTDLADALGRALVAHGQPPDLDA